MIVDVLDNSLQCIEIRRAKQGQRFPLQRPGVGVQSLVGAVSRSRRTSKLSADTALLGQDMPDAFLDEIMVVLAPGQGRRAWLACRRAKHVERGFGHDIASLVYPTESVITV